MFSVISELHIFTSWTFRCYVNFAINKVFKAGYVQIMGPTIYFSRSLENGRLVS